MRLTLFSKIFISLIILGTAAFVIYKNPQIAQQFAPPKKEVESMIPPTVELPALPEGPAQATGNPAAAALPGAGCADKPEVRFFHWAWNSQMGLLYATGGKQAVAGSLMCKEGVNLKLVREDNTDNMQALLVTFAERLKAGQANPADGAHFINIMGDGTAAFLKGLNDKLIKLGPDYIAVVVGSTGYSRGEDKFMGPLDWKQDPQKSRGGLVAGVLRDGDWNIAMKWLGDNRVPNNPDEKTWDPDALNWVAASDYVDAAQKYVSGFCVDLKDKKTGQTVNKCVNGVVTWTPGDVTVAEKKGGLVSIVSTREYRWQMPSAIIGIKKWVQNNRPLVQGMLSATFQGGDAVKESDEALRKAAEVSAVVYAEKEPAYWYKYFRTQTEKDAQGLIVELGGSAVSNLADNMQLFGLVTGSTNLYAATYSVFGDIVKQQYPSLMPSYYPASQVVDVSFVQQLGEAQKGKPAPSADMPIFTRADKVREVVSRRSWDIQFETGSARFSGKAERELSELFRDLVVAGGTLVEVHGHTDNQGTAESNQALSEARAFAVKEWLEKKAPTSFPESRVRVFAHGMSEPVAPNATPDGRAKNRRVEIVMGTN